MLWNESATILSRLRQSGLFGPNADNESGNNLPEEDSSLNLSIELAQLFNSGTDCFLCTVNNLYGQIRTLTSAVEY